LNAASETISQGIVDALVDFQQEVSLSLFLNSF